MILPSIISLSETALAVGCVAGESAALMYTAGFSSAFSIATILLILTAVIHLSASLVGKKLKRS